MNLADFHFLRPLWLLALLALPLLPWLWRRLGGASGGWQGVVDAHLLRHQLQRGRRARAAPALAMLAWAIAVVALAGPAWRELPQPLQQREAALAIVLEVSDSMRAADLPPDRLSRARYALTDLLRTRRDGQFALVAYAGAAFTVAPVTDDGTTLLALLDALDPAQMPVAGASADRALRHAATVLERAGYPRGDILLVADGASAEAAGVAAELNARGYTVSVLGVGTEAGAPVALAEGGFLKDASGAIVVPGLEEDALAEVAAQGGGRYRRLDAGGSGNAIAGLGLLDAGGGRFEESGDMRRAFADDGPWLLLLLLPLAALGFRRGWLGCVLLAGLLPPPAAMAFEWNALWQRDDQRAWDALHEGEPQAAAALARSPALRGSALYRAGEPAAAAEAFAQGSDADAHYNRGNALARAERFEEALDAYADALALDPAMEDALANQAAVEQWLRQQQQQAQSGEDPQSGQEQGNGGQSPPQDGEGEDKGEEGEPGESGSQGEPQQRDPGDAEGDGERRSGDEAQEDGEAASPEAADADETDGREFGEQMQQALEQARAGEGEDGQPAPADADPASMEQRQAVEQWLRRVPDDPGGLLRRKFLIEHQRRMREGEEQ